MPRERILIAVKTYPTLSESHVELACTAGFRQDGSWIRLFPIPFRLLENEQQYKKYQWIEADIAKSKKDKRPESYNIINTDTIIPQEKVSSERNWEARKRIILDKNKIYTSLSEVIEDAHSNKISLAVFKPTSIEGFKVAHAPKEWPQDKLKRVLESMKQTNFFDKSDDLAEFTIMPKLPYKFSYHFKDENEKSSQLMIEDWEIGQLYWNCLKSHNEVEARKKIEEKYMDDFARSKDLHLFLGTTYEHHNKKAPNPYVIIGTFHPPFEKQASLF